MADRRSTRAFRPDPVPRETVERILALAARAPSGSNIQPWKVHVLAGAARARVVAALTADHAAGASPPKKTKGDKKKVQLEISDM